METLENRINCDFYLQIKMHHDKTQLSASYFGSNYELIENFIENKNKMADSFQSFSKQQIKILNR